MTNHSRCDEARRRDRNEARGAATRPGPLLLTAVAMAATVALGATVTGITPAQADHKPPPSEDALPAPNPATKNWEAVKEEQRERGVQVEGAGEPTDEMAGEAAPNPAREVWEEVREEQRPPDAEPAD